MCLCFLPIHSGHQVRWTYQPGSLGRKVTQYFSSTFLIYTGIIYVYVVRNIPNSRPNVSRLSQEVTSELPGRQYATVFTVQQPQLSFVVPVTIDLLCKTRLTCPARVQRKIQNTDVSKPSEHVICMYLYVGIRLCRNARVCRSAGGRRGDYAHLEAVLLRVNCLRL